MKRMDLKIAGRKAIICASSKGLGKACAQALAAEGVDVWISARSGATLQATADEINAAGGGRATAVVADVTTDAGREALFEACPAPDILVNNAGGPAPGDFRNWDQKDWFDAVNANMYSAIDMIRRCLDGMLERRFGRIVNITSVAVKMPVPVLGLSNGARSGLTGFIAGIAREPAQHNVTINNLLPGYIATGRMWSVMEAGARQAGVDKEIFQQNLFNKIGARRPGDPQEFGATCAFLCSQHAAYITAQNVLIDGGLYPGTL
jgi:3-oxoacyl-[acyl-carrier protein] reductase